MKYSWFELLAMSVGACAVVGTSLATVSGANMGPEVVGQVLILLALFGGLHYGRKGAVVCFLASTSIYAIVAFSFMSGQLAIALELFLFRTGIYGVVAFAAGELNTHLKYLFVKLEHHDYVDDLTGLYNSKYFSKLLEKQIGEFDRYGSEFSMASFAIKEDLFSPLKDKVHNKLIRDIGNTVIRNNIRGVDDAARIAGTLFMVLFPKTDLEGAKIATNRISGKIRSYLDSHGLSTEREETIKTEVLEYPPDKDTIEELFANLSETTSS